MLLSCVLVVVLGHAQYVSLEGKQFYNQAGQPFYPMICNYEATLSCSSCVHGNGEAALADIEIVPNNDYGTTPKYEFDFGRGEDRVKADLAVIKSMGFNTVRIMGLYFSEHDHFGHAEKPWDWKEGGTNGGRFICRGHSNPEEDWWGHPLIVNSPYAKDYNLNEIYIPEIKKLLDIAAELDLKVILVCGGGAISNSIGANLNTDSAAYFAKAQAEDFADYLSALGTGLKNHKALLAYDLFNEPVFVTWHEWGPATTANKSKIARFNKIWYDSLKTSDNNHLITMSNWDIGDVMTYDPSILAVDFNSFHIYPAFLTDKQHEWDTQWAMKLFLQQLYWINHHCGHPWILGETAGSSWTKDGADVYGQDTNSLAPFYTERYAGKNMSTMPFVWGSYNKHGQHIQDLQNAVLAFGGSGFAYWGFQDQNKMPDLESEHAANDWFNKYEGLLHTGDAHLKGNLFVYDTIVFKPFVKPGQSVFANRVVNKVIDTASPADYYHPYGAPRKGYYSFDGYVRDENGMPINEALVTASNNWGAFSARKENAFTITAFTDTNGHFILTSPIPRRGIRPRRDAVFFHVQISAASYSMFECDNRNREPRPCPRNGATIVLNRVE